MTILNRLAISLNRRDEKPNVELAKVIVRTHDSDAVKELVENLFNKDKNIQSDCIKVLYEIGATEPKMIAPYFRDFGVILESRNNRLVWGAMTALDSIALAQPIGVYGLLSKILVAANQGSVIARDHAVGILAKLGSLKQYSDECVPLLIDQLAACPNNQFAMYAEKSLPVVRSKNREEFREVIAKRLKGLAKESQKKRVERVLKQLERLS